MTNFFRNLVIDPISFWLGFVAGALFLIIFRTMRKFLPGFIKATRQQIQDTREKLTAGVETRLRNDVVRQAQKQHLAASFFALDEIAIEPSLMAPPPMLSAHKTPPPVDIVHLTLPYIPDWPELAATYRAPTISLVEALQNQANLVVVGQPGSGKTFALAWLASRIARQDPITGTLANRVPIYFRASDIPDPGAVVEAQPVPDEQAVEEQPGEGKPPEPKTPRMKTPVENLYSIIAKYASPLTLPRLPAFLENSLADKRAILIIDGMDELPPERLGQAVDFLIKLNTDFPGNRLVAAGSFECLDGLTSLGLIPVALAAWGEDQKLKLVARWSQQWSRLVLPYYPPASAPSVETQFINNWLQAKDLPSSPFDLTLKIWGAYAGDILGVDQGSLIESFLRRTTEGIEGARQALEQMALQLILNQSFKAQQNVANQWITGHTESQTSEPLPADELTGVASELPQLHGRVSINALLSSGVLVNLPDSQVSFAHPMLLGYLAGRRLAYSNELPGVQNQPDWAGKAMALYFMSFWGDASILAMSLIRTDDFLYRELLKVARWLRITPRNKAWRSLVLRALAGALNKEASTFALSGKMLTALALSGDQGVAVLFRQLLKSDKTNLRLLAALGSGLVRDSKAIQDLAEMIEDRNPGLARAACLALVEIGDKTALEMVASALMHGGETARRAAAEALANHPTEGHPALEEGGSIDDLMVRRSVVFGLARVREDWAEKILDKLQMEDKEWIVRNAAIQALEERHQPNPHLPQPLPELPETTWLVEYASKQGVGVAAGEQALNLVLQALKDGSEDERLAALEYLALKGDAELASNIYALYFGQSGDLRESAYQALWLLSTTGNTLPPPQQFGYTA